MEWYFWSIGQVWTKGPTKKFLASEEKDQLPGATHIMLPYFDYFILRHPGAANTLNVRYRNVTHNLVGNVGYRASSVGR